MRDIDYGNRVEQAIYFDREASRLAAFARLKTDLQGSDSTGRPSYKKKIPSTFGQTQDIEAGIETPYLTNILSHIIYLKHHELTKSGFPKEADVASRGIDIFISHKIS